jgi:steroid delta-isomerase-like uncharacterized protein
MAEMRAFESSASLSRRTTLHVAAAGLAAGVASSLPVTAGRGAAAAPQLLEEWAAGWSHLADPAALLDIVTPDIVYEDVAAGDLVAGTAAFADLLREAHAAMPDFTITLDTSFVAAEHAAAEYVITGTQSGDLPYLAATGKPFSLRAASIFVLAGDKIQRESRYYNMVSFLTQLGALKAAELPPLGTPAPRPPG